MYGMRFGYVSHKYLSPACSNMACWSQNFMKCLMHMFAAEDKGVVFYETVINIKWQKHTVIECVPLSWDLFEEVPQYFKACTFVLHQI